MLHPDHAHARLVMPTRPWAVMCLPPRLPEVSPETMPPMSNFKTFLHAGHGPTLFAAFLYFAFSCCIWVLNGAMAPFIGETYHLTPAQKGLMLSIPIIAGALMRFPLGVLAQYIGRKKATLVEMGLIAAAMLYGYFAVKSFDDLLAMGV